ncbi:hypothetical protein OLX02_06465 [Novosphingobium sp. KCTC 2891]|uniref:hypothetical protein n=1 Tax=Novosphingobium sp. KCTC 2891 TaxID=2989730 RepID=UPI0022223161|nr:hypothetical protein [Novosphingobium sp. KCTC 2891]MCW1382460.1 hypothetical protein [Novosphingobium sp. KCTC 2891]
MAALAALLALTACDRPDAAPTRRAAPSPTARAVPAPSPAPAEPVPAPSVAPASVPSEAPAPARYAPRDECAAQPGWPAFRARLGDAVKARDGAALAALAAQDVTLDYGGGHGRDELASRLVDPATGAALWADLARILPLGCAARDELAVMPWYFWNVPEDLDPGTAMLATGPSVPLRQRPAPDAPDVAALSWEMVTLAPGFDPAARFTQVETADGRKGYVETASLRSVLARRIIAERKDGEWRVTAVVAGD